MVEITLENSNELSNSIKTRNTISKNYTWKANERQVNGLWMLNFKFKRKRTIVNWDCSKIRVTQSNTHKR